MSFFVKKAMLSVIIALLSGVICLVSGMAIVLCLRYQILDQEQPLHAVITHFFTLLFQKR